MSNNYNDDDPFDRALGITHIPPEATHTIDHLPAIIPEQKVEIKTYVQNDYEFARKTERDLINAGIQLFQDAANMARQTQSPESFQAASTIMKTLIDANEKLVKLSEIHAKVTDGKKNEIKKEKEESAPTYVEHKTIVVTSNDMLDMIKNKNGDTTD